MQQFGALELNLSTADCVEASFAAGGWHAQLMAETFILRRSRKD